MSNELERIQKWLAARGLGSRREIEGWIREGRLRVNGKPAELGQRISGYERLSLDGKPLRVSPEREAPRQVLMYHKPPGEICSRNDPDGRPTVFRHLPKLRQGRWVSIGRLDLNTAGLLLFTNDGELANRLMHPSAEIEREYWVRVAGEVNEDTLQALRNGLELEDGFACFDDVQPLQALHEDDTQYNRYFSVVLKEGRNREVRRIFEHFGLTVSRLVRTGFGPIGLPNRLKRGQFYELNAAEVASVMKWADLPLPDSRRRPG